MLSFLRRVRKTWFRDGAILVSNDTSASEYDYWITYLTSSPVAGQIGVIYGTGVTAGSLCLLRRLESIASTRQAMQTPRDKRRRIIIDLLVGIGFPLLLLPLRYVAQGHRMDIIEEIGCSLPLYISLPSIFLYQIWPLVLSLVSLVYAGELIAR